MVGPSSPPTDHSQVLPRTKKAAGSPRMTSDGKGESSAQIPRPWDWRKGIGGGGSSLARRAALCIAVSILNMAVLLFLVSVFISPKGHQGTPGVRKTEATGRALTESPEDTGAPILGVEGTVTEQAGAVAEGAGMREQTSREAPAAGAVEGQGRDTSESPIDTGLGAGARDVKEQGEGVGSRSGDSDKAAGSLPPVRLTERYKWPKLYAFDKSMEVQNMFIGWTGNSTGDYGRTFDPSEHADKLPLVPLPFNLSRDTAKVYFLDRKESLCQSYFKPCPHFWSCYAFLGSWGCHTALEPNTVCRWRENTVHQLWNVYLTSTNVIFNSTTVFSVKRCMEGGTMVFNSDQPPIEEACSPKECNVPAGTKALWVTRAITLVHTYGTNFYHKFTETLPLMLDIAAFVRDDPDVAIAIRQYQNVHSLRNAIGEGVRHLRFLTVPPGMVLHAQELIVPAPINCVRPTRQLIYEMRRRYYLHPDGFPIFDKDWFPRQLTPLTDEEMAAVPKDWVVVISKREGRRSMDKHVDLRRRLTHIFGRDRVVVFQGDMDVLEAKRLFNRAVLFVGPHGAALTNVQFMPARSFLLEILPDEYRLNCYGLLAEFSGINYHMSLAKGGSNSLLRVNVTDTTMQLAHITRRLKLEASLLP